ncbi:Protein TIFY 6B [Zea mays]|uniref:Protein TIFY 6B n=1 Tax=Zea mays TaxID=4577 RepID=A0A1D6Q1C2_MAIZE|nr:Protein TIFY 6B [Zea mays]
MQASAAGVGAPPCAVPSGQPDGQVISVAELPQPAAAFHHEQQRVWRLYGRRVRGEEPTEPGLDAAHDILQRLGECFRQRPGRQGRLFLVLPRQVSRTRRLFLPLPLPRSTWPRSSLVLDRSQFRNRSPACRIYQARQLQAQSASSCRKPWLPPGARLTALQRPAVPSLLLLLPARQSRRPGSWQLQVLLQLLRQELSLKLGKRRSPGSWRSERKGMDCALVYFLWCICSAQACCRRHLTDPCVRTLVFILLVSLRRVASVEPYLTSNSKSPLESSDAVGSASAPTKSSSTDVAPASSHNGGGAELVRHGGYPRSISFSTNLQI